MIAARDLSKKFDEFVAVDGVHLNIKAGQVLALLGPNGAGKTTTVRMLTAILTPSRGCAWVNGYSVVDQPEAVRASVGVLTEHHSLYARMNAEEYLRFYADLYGIDARLCSERTQHLLSQFGLDMVKGKKLGEFSKGMRQKLALVRALIHDPPVLLLDEPTSAMDPESARIVRDAIRHLRSERRTILICTHNLSEAENLADQIAIIRAGQIILSGSPEEIKHRLLGPPSFEARLAHPTPTGKLDGFPVGVRLAGRGENWLQFEVSDPNHTNPQLIRYLISMGLELTSFQAVPRSLEDAYLQAVSQIREGEYAGS